MLHDGTSRSKSAHSSERHVHLSWLTQQWTALHSRCLGVKSASEQKQPTGDARQSSGRQVHSRPAAGQASGAQQRVSGNAAGLQMKSLTSPLDLQVHAEPSPRRGSRQLVVAVPDSGSH